MQHLGGEYTQVATKLASKMAKMRPFGRGCCDTANGQWDVRYQKAFCFVGAEVPLYFMYICKLYRCMVSQKKEYTGCTELTAVLYSYSIFFNTGVYNITHYC